MNLKMANTLFIGQQYCNCVTLLLDIEQLLAIILFFAMTIMKTWGEHTITDTLFFFSNIGIVIQLTGRKCTVQLSSYNWNCSDTPSCNTIQFFFLPLRSVYLPEQHTLCVSDLR